MAIVVDDIGKFQVTAFWLKMKPGVDVVAAAFSEQGVIHPDTVALFDSVDKAVLKASQVGLDLIMSSDAL